MNKKVKYIAVAVAVAVACAVGYGYYSVVNKNNTASVGASENKTGDEQSITTILGRITDVEDKTVTLALVNVDSSGAGGNGQMGTLPDMNGGGNGQGSTPPEMPSGNGDNSQNGNTGDQQGMTPPANPSGDNGAASDGSSQQGQAPQNPDSNSNADGSNGQSTMTPPQMPSGNDNSSQNGDTGNQQGQTPPSDQSGNSGTASDGSSQQGQAPQNPGGNSNADGSGDKSTMTPPQMPSGNGDGSTQDGQGQGGNPPEMPSGSGDGNTQGGPGQGGNPKEMPSGGNGGAPGMGGQSGTTYTLTGEEKTITIDDESLITVLKGNEKMQGTMDDIIIGEILSVSYDKEGNIEGIEVQSNNTGYTGGSQTGNIELKGNTTVDGEDKDIKSQEIKSETSDETSVLVTNGATSNISDATISKSGDTSSEDESNFYAINSSVVAAAKGIINISDSKVTTSSEGSNGIFATGDGTLINVKNVTIDTTSNSSRGLDATYNGTIIADGVTISTKGAHCASVATDRGEGTIHLTDCTGTSEGDGSPGIYSTGRITARGCSFTAYGSQAAVIEGKNSISLYDSTLVGYKTNGVMLYQSYSGDSGEGTCYFNMSGGSIEAKEGPMFYITNTSAVINLKNAGFTTSTGVFLNAATGRWGNSGSNGGDVTVNAKQQSIDGDITADSISTVILNLKDSSSLKGTVNGENTAKSIELNLDKESSWDVAGDSYVTVITDEDESLANIKDNGHTIYYDASNDANSWLNSKTVELSGGGKLVPVQ